jgi:hypothetical protein
MWNGVVRNTCSRAQEYVEAMQSSKKPFQLCNLACLMRMYCMAANLAGVVLYAKCGTQSIILLLVVFICADLLVCCSSRNPVI